MGQRGSQPREAKVVLLGLDYSGKSTLLYKLKHNVSVSTVQTIGFNVEMLEAKENGRSVALTLWDVGGQAEMRRYWESFHVNAAAVVFVVDSSDERRLEEARLMLESTLMSEQLQARPLLLLANKQDVQGALTATELTDKLNLRHTCSDRDWFVQPCSASTGFGVDEAMRRMIHVVKSTTNSGAMKDTVKDTIGLIRRNTRI